MHDQDQGLTRRYHNTTLDTNKIIQALCYKPGASRARIHKLDTQESTEATISEYRHKLDKISLRRLAQKKRVYLKHGLKQLWGRPMDLYRCLGRPQVKKVRK